MPAPPAGARTTRIRPAAVLIAAVAIVVAVDPVHTRVPLCPFHAVTGWSCPLCGGLRAVDALARGHVFTAIGDNVLLVAAVPVAIAWSYSRRGRARGEQDAHRRRSAVVALVVVAAAFTVLRNPPFADALRP
jgi:hypothetical protein